MGLPSLLSFLTSSCCAAGSSNSLISDGFSVAGNSPTQTTITSAFLAFRTTLAESTSVK